MSYIISYLTLPYIGLVVCVNFPAVADLCEELIAVLGACPHKACIHGCQFAPYYTEYCMKPALYLYPLKVYIISRSHMYRQIPTSCGQSCHGNCQPIPPTVITFGSSGGNTEWAQSWWEGPSGTHVHQSDCTSCTTHSLDSALSVIQTSTNNW